MADLKFTPVSGIFYVMNTMQAMGRQTLMAVADHGQIG
jgi:hypothetical protein